MDDYLSTSVAMHAWSYWVEIIEEESQINLITYTKTF